MGSLNCSLVPLTDCFDDALEFRNENRESGRDRNYFAWRYLDRPCDIGAYVAWVQEGTEVLGAATIAPHDFRTGEGHNRLGVVGDISVSTDARGKGVGSCLLANVRDELPKGVDDVFVLPNAEAKGPLKRAGWSAVGEIERRVRYFHRNWTATPAALTHSAIALLGSLRSRSPLADKVEGIELQPVDSWFNDVDAIWKVSAGRYLCLGFRTSRYLRWRYVSHPNMKYDIEILKRSDDVMGYVVSHVDRGTRWVDDYLVVSEEAAETLAACVIESAIMDEGCNTLQVRQIANDDSRAWDRLGLIRRSDTQATMVGGRLAGLSGQGVRWHLTSGDKDV